MTSISVVIPVYNSQDSIGQVVDGLVDALPSVADRYEIILVEDASADQSWQTIEKKIQEYDCVHGYQLMRNYGQHNALLCGIRKARYEIIVTMDDDLQHPIDKLELLLSELDKGYDVVYGSPQKERHSFLRNIASQMTKFVLQRAMGAEIAQNISAYRVFRTEIRRAFADYHGPNVNIDVLLTWGARRFSAVTVPHKPREIGQSNYTLSKLITHAFNMMTGFSSLPLRLASLLGFLMTLFGGLLLFYVIVIRVIVFGYDVPGFTFLASIIAIFSGAQMFTIGVIGEYLARMHFRLMDKPTYVIRESQDSSGNL